MSSSNRSAIEQDTLAKRETAEVDIVETVIPVQISMCELQSGQSETFKKLRALARSDQGTEINKSKVEVDDGRGSRSALTTADSDKESTASQTRGTSLCTLRLARTSNQAGPYKCPSLSWVQ